MTARILHIDIECKPALVWSYGLWNQNIGIGQIEEPPAVIGWATRWHDEKPRACKYLWADEPNAYEHLWDQLNEATHVVHFNGKTFDMPWINHEFKRLNVYGNGNPPSPYRQIDLMKQTRSNMRSISNKLQYLSTNLLHLDGKIGENALTLWLEIRRNEGTPRGDKARRRMELYCKQDVNLLPDYFNKMLPWLSGLNLNLYGGDPSACPNCASTNIQWRGFAHTTQSSFRRFQCQDCGRWSRSTARESGVKVVEAR